jgi:hypothetical protein
MKVGFSACDALATNLVASLLPLLRFHRLAAVMGVFKIPLLQLLQLKLPPMVAERAAECQFCNFAQQGRIIIATRKGY